ncbi:phosphatase 2C-like protein [Arabidopsis lyrata subsp. lyrata]|uniref:Phosphatase 2C-like protein n=1 Tax=Arabidopsis lyrata subsp. lyrata TaxID=81972 RepID=D7M4N3_ARALL|nr:phosphatase 2C-like protein [Arabidopsis lyrata subsp. lyrata]
MGHCFSLPSSSSEIHEDNEHGDGNAVVFNGLEFGLDHDLPVHRLGSVCSIQGTKVLNQDHAVLYLGYGTRDSELCGVFDGHGKNGHMVSKMVRNRLPSVLLALKEEQNQESNVCEEEANKWENACFTAFRLIDRELNLQVFDCSFSGSTGVVAITQGDDLVIANLGDSRAVLGTTTEDGEIRAVQLTSDLTPNVPTSSSVAGEAERIRMCKGRVFAMKAEPCNQRVWLPNQDIPGLAMSRAFGNFRLKEHGVIAVPEISQHRITSNDRFLVLATDGVWDMLSNDEVVSLIWSSGKKQAEAAKLVAEAAEAAWKKKLKSTKIDDITVICLFLQNKEQPSCTMHT